MKYFFMILLLFSVITGCSNSESTTKQTINKVPKQKIGLLVEGKIADQTWESQAYQGLRQIKEKYKADIDYKEQLYTERQRLLEAEKMGKEGFNLVIGNGNIFQSSFNEAAKHFPHTKYVFFNGIPQGNVTAVNFGASSIGYFTGMVAGLCTKNHIVGVIPAFYDMTTLNYFIQGVKDQDPRNKVLVESVQSWDNKIKAGKITADMIKKGADVLVPLGDGYSIEVTMRAWKAHVHVVSFISDLSYMAGDTVLTSAQQDLVATYLKIANDFYHNHLPSGTIRVDFKDKAQFFAPFNKSVPKEVPDKLYKRLNEYNNGTFKLPKLPGRPI